MSGSTWEQLAETFAASPWDVEVLPPDADLSAAALEALGVSPRSPLGAVVSRTSGVLVDHGWLRLLGGGGGALPSVVEASDPSTRRLVVAIDVLGGRFAWCESAPGAPPSVHYFAPDSLEWEDLGQGYGDWLFTMLTAAVGPFYEDVRWPGWEADVAATRPDEAINTFPPPFTEEGRNLSAVARKVVPWTEQRWFLDESARALSGRSEDPS